MQRARYNIRGRHGPTSAGPGGEGRLASTSAGPGGEGPMTDAGEPGPLLSNLKTHVFSVSETKETSKMSCFRFLRDGTDSLPTQSDWQGQNQMF